MGISGLICLIQNHSSFYNDNDDQTIFHACDVINKALGFNPFTLQTISKEISQLSFEYHWHWDFIKSTQYLKVIKSTWYLKVIKSTIFKSPNSSLICFKKSRPSINSKTTSYIIEMDGPLKSGGVRSLRWEGKKGNAGKKRKRSTWLMRYQKCISIF